MSDQGGTEKSIRRQQTTGAFIAVRHRAFGSPNVYFGPFSTLDELFKWSEKHQLAVTVIELTDPDSSPAEWWD